MLRKGGSSELGRGRCLSAAGVTSVVLIMALSARIASPQDMPVPMEIQLPLLLKILSADRQLRERAGDELVIAVFYQPRYNASVEAMETLLKEADRPIDPPIPDQPIRLVPVPLEGEPNWDSLLSALEVDVCYLAPLRATGLAPILSATRARKIVTCTGVPEYVESGVTVAFGAKAGKPQIIINLESARAEGADFTSQLLKLARIIADG